MLTRSPVLWRKVDVEFQRRRGSQNAVINSFVNRLPSCVTCIRFDFRDHRHWREPVNFTQLCIRLQEKCPRLKVLILHESKLSDSLPLIIDLCIQFLPNVKTLVLHFSEIPGYPTRSKCDADSKIEVLDVYGCYLGHMNRPPFSRMSCLKELHLGLTCVHDFSFKEDISFLNQLEVLNLSDTWTGSTTFQAIQSNALNLKELYMCGIAVEDEDLRLSNSAFPQLKIACLASCHRVTCWGVYLFVQSCESLQNVYVDEDLAETYAENPFIISRYKTGIVKAIDCDHNHNVDYLHR